MIQIQKETNVDVDKVETLFVLSHNKIIRDAKRQIDTSRDADRYK